ncbi:MAG: PorV/PorQ family protein [Gemmatimonadaceae bacterium]
MRGAFVAALVAALAVGAGAEPLRAQGGLSTEGLLVLLVPVGARTVGVGQTSVTAEAGSASLWGNPAGIARATQKEAALHYSKSVVAPGTALGVLYPAGRAGVIGVGAQLYDYGQQELTDNVGNPVGQLLTRDVVAMFAYGATLGPSLRAGVTYKLMQRRNDCTGPCSTNMTYVATTSGFDWGVQWQRAHADSLAVGFAVRQMGLKLQVNDNAQSDPLPTRLHLGVGALVPRVSKALPGAELRWAVELVNRTSLDSPEYRVGGELGLQKQLYLRAGYSSGIGDGTGPAIGFGFVRGAMSIDFARVFGGLSSDAGEPPTFLTMRVNW